MTAKAQQIIEGLLAYLLHEDRAEPLGKHVFGDANPDRRPENYPWITILAGRYQIQTSGNVVHNFIIELTVTKEPAEGPQAEFLEVMEALMSAVVQYNDQQSIAADMTPLSGDVISAESEKGIQYVGVLEVEVRYTINLLDYDHNPS